VDKDLFPDEMCKYRVEGEETCPLTGTKHWQCFVVLQDKMRFSAIKKRDVDLGGTPSHFEKTKGVPYRAAMYCMKGIDMLKRSTRAKDSRSEYRSCLSEKLSVEKRESEFSHTLGDQSHEEWDQQQENGPNFGLNAKFVEFGTRPRKPGSGDKSSKDDVYRDAFDPAVPYSEAMAMIMDGAPRDMAIHGESIARNLAAIKEVPYQHKYFIEDFLRPELPKPPGRSILLHGPSNTGKTHFACAHFQNPLLVSDIDQLKKFNPKKHDGLVFDDMSFHHIPPEKVIHLVDQEFQRAIRCRHVNASIPANTPKIFTHNTSNPFYNVSGIFPPSLEQQRAIDRRLECWNVPSPLYKRSGVNFVNDMTVCSLIGAAAPAQEAVFHVDG